MKFQSISPQLELQDFKQRPFHFSSSISLTQQTRSRKTIDTSRKTVISFFVEYKNVYGLRKILKLIAETLCSTTHSELKKTLLQQHWAKTETKLTNLIICFQ